MIRALWIGLPANNAPAWRSSWCINDFAVDLADAELFTLSRKYDAVIYAKFADTYAARRSIESFKERFPHMLIVGLGTTKPANRERRFFEAGGDEFVSFPQCLDSELVRLRIERLVLNHFTNEVFSLGDLRVDPGNLTVYVGEEPVVLRKNIFKVFYRLVLMQKRFISKDEFLSVMYENPEYVTGSGIEHAVCVIRERIDRQFGIETIRTLRKKGYGFVYNS